MSKESPAELKKDWDYHNLMGGINPELRNRIQKLGLEKKFLAWLIAGSLNTDIHSPVSFAIAATLENQQSAAAPAARLADLPADELSRLLRKTISRIKQNYLGPVMIGSAAGEDLESLLQSTQDRQQRLKLLRRMADTLGLEG